MTGSSSPLVANRVPRPRVMRAKDPGRLATVGRAGSTPASAIAFRDVISPAGPSWSSADFRRSCRGRYARAGWPGGAGKSTILKLPTDRSCQTPGCPWNGGAPRVGSAPAEAAAGYVMQEVGLFPHLSVAENIAIVPRLLGWDDRKSSQSGRAARVGGAGH